MLSQTFNTSLGSSNGIIYYYSKYNPMIDRDSALEIQHERADFIVRACLAFLRSQRDHSPDDLSEVPSERYSHTWRDGENDRIYVCLGDETGNLLAVYRLDTREKLKRLRRYPKLITDLFLSVKERNEREIEAEKCHRIRANHKAENQRIENMR